MRECMTLVRPVEEEEMLYDLNSLPDHRLRREFVYNQLPPQHNQLSETELNERLEDVIQQLQTLTEQLIVAEQMASAVAKKRQLETEKRQLEQELKKIMTLYQQLQAQYQDRTQQRLNLPINSTKPMKSWLAPKS